MNKEKMSAFLIEPGKTVVDAMGQIDQNAKGILFVVDENKCLQGCITDGDIRRWLIRTGDLSATVEHAMTLKPQYVLDQGREEAYNLMEEKLINAVPVLDKERHVIDIILLSDAKKVAQKSAGRSLKGIPVVIMAGGKGTRLYPYTKILPKPLIPIGDTPIVERIINIFLEYGIDHYYMTVNYKKGMIKSYFSDFKHPYSVDYVEEPKPLGTGGSIKLIEEHFDKPIFVTNCDALILGNYADIYDYHKKAGNAITIVSSVKNIVIPYGVLHSQENGELIDLEEKPQLSYLINTGMYIINPETISEIPDNEMFHMTQLVEKVKDSGGRIGVYPVSEDSFLDMGEFDGMHRKKKKLNLVAD